MNRRELIAATVSAAMLPRLLWSTGMSLDVAYVNGLVWTGSPGPEHETSLGTIGNRIAAVGRDEVQAATGPATRIVDLDGAFVVPGFIDNHTHFLHGSLGLSRVDLLQATTPREFASTIADAAQDITDGQWLQGGNWDEQRWGGELPDRSWIDDVTPDTPVAVTRTDLHMMLVNSLALRLAGIDRGTPNPPGGVILRDASGEPTGIIKDEAKALILRAIPEPTDIALDRAMQAGIDHALSLGVTQVHVKAINWDAHGSLRRLRAKAETGVRFYSYVPLGDWERLAGVIEADGRGDDWVRWGGLKGLIDGSLGSRTALFYEPYIDDPGNRGITVADPDDLRYWISAADRRGLQVAMHAIGDEANDRLLDLYSSVIRENGPRDRRFLVEHAQHVRPESVARFAELGIVPSMQPYHAIDDGRWAVKRIGPGRLDGTYAFRSMLDTDARLSFGSDWPVAPISPLAGVAAAVLRRTTDGANPNGWLPEQKISVNEALTAYTITNAYAGFQENRLGRLAPGFLADFVVLGADLVAVDPSKISSVPVLRTVVDGRVRYDSLQ